jgi:methyltransferase
MSDVHLIVLVVALQRLCELVLAARNTRRLKEQGASEYGSGHYVLLILLHVSWLLAVAILTPPDRSPDLFLLALFILLQLGRVWVIATLGRFWTTRIIIPRDRILIRTGPYRYLHHPNYLIVAMEIAILPLMFGNVRVAVFWSIANFLLLAWRICIEDAALAA